MAKKKNLSCRVTAYSSLDDCSNGREATSPDYRLELGIGRPGWTADLRKHFWMAGPGGRIYDSFFQVDRLGGPDAWAHPLLCRRRRQDRSAVVWRPQER